MSARIDPALKAWASPRQAEIVDLVNELGTIAAAAAQLGISRSTINDFVRVLKARAERGDMLKDRGAKLIPAMQPVEVTDSFDGEGELQSFSVRQRPLTDVQNPDEPLPGFAFKQISTLYGREREVALEWRIQNPKLVEQWQMARQAYEELAKPFQGLSPLIAPPKGTDNDLLTVYPMGDPHFGLYSWARETGDNFDLDEAHRLTCGAVDRLVALSPPSRYATLLNLGDFFHADDTRNRTPQSGHALDVDNRHYKVVQVGIQAMRWAVLRLLEKHEFVRIRNVPGNHDPHAHLALTVALMAYFENNPRVHVDDKPGAFSFYRFGKVLIGECHGDTAKAPDLPGVMMNDAREHISETEYWHWHCGHVHHDSIKEYQGVTVETHRTLAGKDAWHASMGYRSGRTMKSITYHREFGEEHRQVCPVARLVSYAAPEAASTSASR